MRNNKKRKLYNVKATILNWQHVIWGVPEILFMQSEFISKFNLIEIDTEVFNKYTMYFCPYFHPRALYTAFDQIW